MLRNYFKLFYRNFTRQGGYNLINITGLAIGIACSIFIALYVFHELSYDTFNSKAANIYRVAVKGKMNNNVFSQAVTAVPMAAALKSDIPEVKQTVRIGRYGAWLVSYKDKKYNEDDFLFADSTFFDVFDFKLIKGDPKTALTKPKSVVLTKNAVARYFGKEDPMGKLMQVEQDTTYYEVTGVMENVPSNSHFKFDLLGSIHTIVRPQQFANWLSHNLLTYVVVTPGTSEKVLNEKMNALIPKYVGPQLQQILGQTIQDFQKQGNSFGYFVQPLLSIHLHSNLQYELEPNSDVIYVYIFSIVAIFIIFIACINYMNLATARSANRAKEVGLRKVLGSTRLSLVNQFITESVFVSFLAFLLAIIFVELLLPAFSNLINLKLNLNYFQSWYIIPGLIFLILFVGLTSGSYPAFFLARFKPVEVLKGRSKTRTTNKLFRSVLVVFQFSISIFILLSTFTVYQQLRYMMNKNLGFDKDQVLIIRRSDRLTNKIETFKQELLKNPEIIAVSYSNSIPGRQFSNNGCMLEGQNSQTTYIMQQAWVNFDYAKTLSLKMAEGRFFSTEYKTDSTGAVINETAVKYLGFKSNKDAIGKRLIYPEAQGKMRYFPIIGIMKDYHFQSLHKSIEPHVLTMMRGNWEGFVLLKLRPDKLAVTVKFTEKIFKQYSGDFPFQYFYLDDDYAMAYRAEKQTGKILLIFSIMAILIACLGLLGLVSFMAEQRTREIGIRKAIGASHLDINMLMVKEIVKLVLISTVFVVPFAYLVMRYWLTNFAYHISISPVPFIVVAIITFVIAIGSVSYQSIKASFTNPAKALKYE